MKDAKRNYSEVAGADLPDKGYTTGCDTPFNSNVNSSDFPKGYIPGGKLGGTQSDSGYEGPNCGPNC